MMDLMPTGPVIDLSNAVGHEGIGGKAAGLADLMAAGETVPDGFVVPAGAIDGLAPETLAGPLNHLRTEEVAVRSSGAAEDGAATSMAGAFDTVLNVAAQPKMVVDAVRRVGAGGPTVSVVVQAMLAPDSAGVAFSANPVTGDPEVTISAVAGLGDRLMSGEDEGEQWVQRGTKVTGDGGVLTHDEVRQVTRVARRLSTRLGHEVDIEWAFVGDELHLLQCRPITALPVQPDFEVPAGTWEKDVAHSSGPLSPMFQSLGIQSEQMMSDWAGRFGMMLGGLRIESLGGETYTQAVPLIGKSDSGPTPPWWVLAVVARVVPKVRRRMATAAEAVESGLLEQLPRRWYQEWKPELTALMDRYRTTDLAALGDTALLSHADDVRASATRALEIHFDLFVPYLVGVHRFVTVCRGLLGWDEGQSLELLAGASPASAAPTLAMGAIADHIGADPKALAAVDEGGDVIEALRPINPDLADEVQDWATVYGFRTADYDVAAPIVSEIPGLVDQLLRDAIATPTGRSSAASEALKEARASLEGDDIEVFETALTLGRDIYPLREDNVHLTAMTPLAALRLTILEVGRRAATAGLIAEAGDVMFLEWDELVQLLGEDSFDAAATVTRRKAEHAWVTAHPGPLRHGPEPGPPPDLKGLPSAGRMINQAIIWAMEQELTPPPEPDGDGDGVKGIGCGAGRYTGPVRVIHSEADFHKLRPGDVLVCPIATPSWAAVFATLGAIVCDGGGALSHTAIVAREHGLPTVMATGNATAALQHGELVTVDGSAGTVRPADSPSLPVVD